MYSDSFSCNDCGGTERYGRTRTCKSCHKLRCKQYYLENKDRLKRKATTYYADNKDTALARVHVPWNLRVIPAKLNLSKSNKLPEGIYNE